MATYPCIVCCSGVRERQEALQCDRCLQWQHRTCGSGISQKDYRRMNRGELDDMPWYCFTCPPKSTGYMLFMGDQREVLRQTQPGLAFHEITKLVAQRWAALDQIAKTKYLEAAEADKERYQKEMEEYQKTDAYKDFLQKQRKAETPSPPKKTRKENGEERKEEEEEEEEEEEPLNPHSALEIPIFTEEFLTHNKVREGELRQLRKSNTDYEEQNAILQKHIESMKSTVDRLESETKQQQSNNAALLQHIETLRRTLARAFSNLPLPGSDTSPTEDTIDSYMVQLHSLIVNNPQQHQSLIQAVRGIVSQLSLT